MKKVILSLISLSIITYSSFFSVKAQNPKSIETIEETIVNDEYSMLLQEAKMYEAKKQSVLMMDVTEKERYLEVKKAIADYPNFIYEQQKLSDDELKSQCYTDKQIIAIRAFNGDESLIPLASATVSATLSATEFKYYSSSNRTYLAIKLTVKWSGSPLIRSQDTVALRLGGTTSNYIEASSTGKVTFDNGIVLTSLNSRGETNGRLYKFGMQYNGSTMRSFEFTFRGFGDGKMTGSSYAAVYAHATITFNTGFGIDFSGKDISGCGISFGIESGFDELYYDFKNISKYI